MCNADNGKIEHIYYPAMQETVISAIFGQKGGNAMVAACTEQQAINCAINDVADGACKYERNAKYRTKTYFFRVRI